jgi:hypothetical protein
MSKAFTPSFKINTKNKVAFSTNNPLAEDRKSKPVVIIEPSFNEVTRTMEILCSDDNKRFCRIDRINSKEALKALNDQIQKAYDNQTRVVFIAAGGNDPDVWFYTVVDSI